MLIRAAVASGSQPRFVYLSALGVREHASNPYLVGALACGIDCCGRAGCRSRSRGRRSSPGPDRDESRPLERVGATVADAAAGIARLFGAHRLAGSVRSMTGPELADGLVRHAFDAAAENAMLGHRGAALEAADPTVVGRSACGRRCTGMIAACRPNFARSRSHRRRPAPGRAPSRATPTASRTARAAPARSGTSSDDSRTPSSRALHASLRAAVARAAARAVAKITRSAITGSGSVRLA